MNETTDAQDLLSGIALTTFRLNGQVLALAERLAEPVGLTAARWQVLGAVLRHPDTVSGIARTMGLTRQSVQRLADLLVDAGLAEYVDNPAHRRAKLVQTTDAGLATVRGIDPGHAEAAERLVDALGLARLTEALETLEHLSRVFGAIGAASPPRPARHPRAHQSVEPASSAVRTGSTSG